MQTPNRLKPFFENIGQRILYFIFHIFENGLNHIPIQVLGNIHFSERTGANGIRFSVPIYFRNRKQVIIIHRYVAVYKACQQLLARQLPRNAAHAVRSFRNYFFQNIGRFCFYRFFVGLFVGVGEEGDCCDNDKKNEKDKS